MFDTQQYLIPLNARRAVAVSDTAWGLAEMEGLFETLGGQVVHRVELNLRRVDPGTYVGSGQLDQLAQSLKGFDADVLLLDFDISPGQLKNIERQTKALVLDRSGVILEIFSRHAKTKEAKLQVECARLEYLMPRLAHLWSHFERQKGSGGGALKGKGMGETQIEVDRRLVKDRINGLKRKIKEVEASRELRRRSRDGFYKVALVGYTNAGKSTLLNALTQSDVLVEDALFATLDAAVRVLSPKARPPVLAIDTVGFIDRLPHSLVASFRSTLGEAREADLLVHVMDASDPEVKRHFEVSRAVLKEIIDPEGSVRASGQDEKQTPLSREESSAWGGRSLLLVFNKVELATPEQLQMLKLWAAGLVREGERPVQWISARSSEQVSVLREMILKIATEGLVCYDVVVPFSDGKTLAEMSQWSNVEQRQNLQEGVFLRLKADPIRFQQMNWSRFQTGVRKSVVSEEST